jgi:ATP-dependent RNA circularization protein (DNA/RNA ligase family)
MNWLVKLARGDWETVLYGFKHLQDALDKRDQLREQYQTDEYYVEEYQIEKAGGYRAR